MDIHRRGFFGALLALAAAPMLALNGAERHAEPQAQPEYRSMLEPGDVIMIDGGELVITQVSRRTWFTVPVTLSGQ
jgi:hypothetical protein